MRRLEGRLVTVRIGPFVGLGFRVWFRAKMSRVLVVGAGLTGSVCACLLRREMASKVHIVVWDKARGPGELHSVCLTEPNRPFCSRFCGPLLSAEPWRLPSEQKIDYSQLLIRLMNVIIDLFQDFKTTRFCAGSVLFL